MTLRCLVLLLSAACAWPADLRVGQAAVRITPPAGIPLAGYYNVRLAEGTHDDLYAKALVFDSGGSRAALVACDLIGLDRRIVEAARRRVSELTGISGDRVMISATHSHTGPLLDQMFLEQVQGRPREIAREYLDALPGKIAESVKLATGNLAPARLRAATGREDALSFNRRFLMKDGTIQFNPGKQNAEIVRPVGPIDPEVPVIWFESPEGTPRAVAVNFAMHLDTVGGVQFSADYPYTISTLLARMYGPDLLTFFTIGTAGNVNHLDVASSAPQQGHGEARRIGTVLAGEVLKTSARAPLFDKGTFKVHVSGEVVALPLAPVAPGAAEKAERVEFEKAPFLDVVNAFKIRDVTARQGRPIPAEVQVIALGDQVAWVGLPGEIFVELGLAIKKASPFPFTVVTELANGDIGYVPDRAAYPQGAYEVISATVGPGSGEMLVESAVRQLITLHKKGE